jgi:hypothetical protein
MNFWFSITRRIIDGTAIEGAASTPVISGGMDRLFLAVSE